MVNIISLDKVEKQTLKPKTTSESNIDFLEALLKGINDKKSKISLKDDIKQDLKSKDDKLDKMLDNMLEHLEKPQTLTLFNQLDKDKGLIKEIKNIISSQLKQDNILLSKKDIKQFKKFDNLKDLLNFANKKLNIKEIKFDIQKAIKKYIDIKPQPLTPKTNEIIKQHIKTNIKNPINNKQDDKISQNIKKETIPHKKISLNDILNQNNKTEKIIKKEIPIVKENKISQNEKIKHSKDKDKKVDIKTKSKNDIKPTNLELETDKKIKTKSNKEINKNIIHTEIKESKKEVKIDLNSLLNKDKSNKIIDKPQKQTQNENNTIINNNPITINDIRNRIDTKQTLESFKNNLDEAIKNYKPPISKVNIELNPKNLGKVEVSIIQRGNNIQVHLNSDVNNINLFQTHQAEFRQALSNIGFNNIDMSFNQNQNKDERKRNQAKKAYEENDEIQEVADIEIKASYKYA